MIIKGNGPVLELYNVLVNSYALYLKLQNYHWNVEGANFTSLHEMFGNQYEELAEAIDEIAERIRGLGAKVPTSFKIFSQIQNIEDARETYDWRQMVKDLKESHATLCALISKAIEASANHKDEGSMDMMIDRLKSHQKSIWMLEATLGE